VRDLIEEEPSHERHGRRTSSVRQSQFDPPLGPAASDPGQTSLVLTSELDASSSTSVFADASVRWMLESPSDVSGSSTLASAVTRQPLGSQVQVNSSVGHSSGLDAHKPVPLGAAHQPQPSIGVQEPQLVYARQDSPPVPPPYP
jgi:hypothetical protein